MADRPRPSWAPPELPDGAIEMIEQEQLLQNIDVRGLASGDSQEFGRAVDKLVAELERVWNDGNEAGRGKAFLIGVQWYVAGFIVGASVGGLATHFFL